MRSRRKTGYIVSMVLSMGSKLILIAMVAVLSRGMSPEELGLYEIFQTTMILLLPLLTMGLAEAIFRFSADDCVRDYGHARLIYSRYLLQGLALISLAFLLVFPLTLKFWSVNVVILAYVTILTTYIYESVKQLRRARGQLIICGIIDLCYALLLGGVTLAMYIMGCLSFDTAISAVAVSSAGTAIIGFLLLGGVTDLIISKDILRVDTEHAKYALLLMPNTLLWWVVNVSDKYILQYVVGASAVGLYAVATKFPTLLTAMYRVVNQLWQYFLLSGERPDMEQLWRKKKWALGGTYLGALALALTFFDFLVGKQFKEAITFIPLLFLGALYSVLSSMIGAEFVKGKAPKFALKSTVSAGTLSLFMNILLVPFFGIWGCVVSTFTSFMLLFVIRCKYLCAINPVAYLVMSSLRFHLFAISGAISATCIMILVY